AHGKSASAPQPLAVKSNAKINAKFPASPIIKVRRRFFVMPHRYFCPELVPELPAVTLTGADAHHLAAVMRAKAGEDVTLCDARGSDYACTVRRAAPESVELVINSCAPSVSEPSVRVMLYVGYPKQDKLESVVQKATELGAVRIVPFFSRYCVAAPKKEEQKNTRYQRIAHEAAKQSGRGIVPQVDMPLTYEQMLSEAAKAEVALLCYEAAAGQPPLHSRIGDGVKTIAVITGSEGGFSAEEVQRAMEAGCICIGLGPRILRCETAPLAALAAVMTLTGNLQ
ncbi:MAG: RsmE family RNA methyltransferase, partial [Ruthenibacterium sp.]